MTDAVPGPDERAPMRLPAGACLELLRSGYTGRLGYVLDERPIIVPVNYRIDHDESILIASRPGAKVRAARSGALLCLEVDGTHEVRRAGWSVLATGHAEVIEGSEAVAIMRRAMLRPWASGDVDLAVLRLTPVLLEGRRVRRSADVARLRTKVL